MPTTTATQVENQVGQELDQYSLTAPRREESEAVVRRDSSVYRGEVYLRVQPHSDPIQVFRFCQSLREIEGADIAYFDNSVKGTAIKLALREPVAILEQLAQMDEVDTVVSEDILTGDLASDLPSFLEAVTADQAVRVTLKAG